MAWDRLPAGGRLDACPFASLWAESASCSVITFSRMTASFLWVTPAGAQTPGLCSFFTGSWGQGP